MIVWRRLWRRLGVVLNLRDPPVVPAYGWSYFDHIVALYITLNVSDRRADQVIEKSRERPDDLTWGDVFLLENVVFTLQPTAMLERNAWMIRERFRSIASPTIYQKYVDSGLPVGADTPAKEELLRADLCRVLDMLHWYYSLIPQRERIRKSLTVACVWCVVLYTALLGLTGHYLHSNHLAMMMVGVVYSGCIGGFVSSQRRMQNIPSDGDPLVSVLGLDISGYYLWLSPMLGAIFAVLLMFMFMGGILQGIAFPLFQAPTDASHPLSLWATLPASGADYGKLFVWAFLAGFAERLVPDSLDRLSSKVLSSKEPGPSAPPPPPPGGGKGGQENGAQQNGVEEPSDKADAQVDANVVDNALHSGQEPPVKEEGPKGDGS